MPVSILSVRDDNIGSLRERYPDGLHFVVGDIHGEVRTLINLMKKIRFAPEIDRLYFLGDYNGGVDPTSLLEYLSCWYQPDCAKPGFHLIRGNHERELFPVYPLENLPDIIVIRGNRLNYYLVHAGMVAPAFRLINEDMAKSPEQRFFVYRLDNICTAYDAPLRQIIWSRRGLYSQRSRWRNWPSEEELLENRACILHGHTPYCFFRNEWPTYGDRTLFWDRQHIYFAEDLQSFNLDANIKGRVEWGGSSRGLACLCLEVCEEIAAQSGGWLSIAGLRAHENGVFAAEYDSRFLGGNGAPLDRILRAAPEMKTITLDACGQPVITG